MSLLTTVVKKYKDLIHNKEDNEEEDKTFEIKHEDPTTAEPKLADIAMTQVSMTPSPAPDPDSDQHGIYSLFANIIARDTVILNQAKPELAQIKNYLTNKEPSELKTFFNNEDPILREKNQYLQNCLDNTASASENLPDFTATNVGHYANVVVSAINDELKQIKDGLVTTRSQMIRISKRT